MLKRATIYFALFVACVSHVPAQSLNDPDKQLPPIELTDFIYEVLPVDGFSKIGWDYLVDHPAISRQTDGTESNNVATRREGVVRLSHMGAMPKVLRRKWEDLPWSIALFTNQNPKFGPERILLQPSGKKNDSCFGYLYTGCHFHDVKLLEHPKLIYRLVCDAYLGADPTHVYEVSAIDKKASLVVYKSSSGSGGSSAWLEIRPLSDQSSACTP